MGVSHLEADRAVVMHCSFDTAVGILQDIAIAAPCESDWQQGVRSASEIFVAQHVIES